jgi:hypothetical protein
VPKSSSNVLFSKSLIPARADASLQVPQLPAAQCFGNKLAHLKINGVPVASTPENERVIVGGKHPGKRLKRCKIKVH